MTIGLGMINTDFFKMVSLFFSELHRFVGEIFQRLKGKATKQRECHSLGESEAIQSFRRVQPNPHLEGRFGPQLNEKFELSSRFCWLQVNKN
jgi:hypothetical protein